MPGIPALWRQKGHKFKTSPPLHSEFLSQKEYGGCVCDDISLSAVLEQIVPIPGR